MRLTSTTSQYQWVLYMLQTPLRSMQLQTLYIWWQERFRGIPWNYSCHRHLRSPSSMEFHGTALISEIGALQAQWNSMELLVSSKLVQSKFHGIPWHSMELLGSSKLTHFKFHGTPWNSMELSVSSKLAHSKFHGIPWNCSCHRNWRNPSSMEFHGIFFCYLVKPLASSVLWDLNLDRIPWHLSFQILIKIISNFAG